MHVDVRGPWPVFVNNMFAITLEHKPRDISVEEAKRCSDAILAERQRFQESRSTKE